MNIYHPKARLIAFYLPQFHPIPENDRWWGKGFTEWTNVTKAHPLFDGHYQPRFAADLGYYDLRVPETRLSQAEMAQECGVEGFCYWHYWFAGKRLLERPFLEVLKSGKPNFPFCLAWANETWTGIWGGDPHRILMKQSYPGRQDYEVHFYEMIDALSDERYITVDKKPIFLIYKPSGLPDPRKFTDCWQELAIKSGLKGLFFVGCSGPEWVPQDHGFDACVIDPTALYRKAISLQTHLMLCSNPVTFLYEDVIKYALPELKENVVQYPCVVPNWDDTARYGRKGLVLHNSTPELFKGHLKQAIAQVRHRQFDHRVIFIKSWNEWAEGNYLEPDQRFGKAYLEVIKEEIVRGPSATSILNSV